MMPFFTYYSMFGFQRIGDLMWLAGDIQARGFLLGATAGRTTLNGEGLQHQDGQGLLLASIIPACRAYDPTFAYEVAVLIRQGLERMYGQGEDCYFYITLLNENYPQPAMPAGVEEGIGRGMYLVRKGGRGKLRVQLMGSGAILRECLAAADLLAADFKVQADVWSVLGINQLHSEGMEIEEWNRFHPEQPRRRSYVEEVMAGFSGPAVLATDYVRAYGEQMRRLLSTPLTVLGTDGFGRSDTRAALRDFFRVDRHHIAVAALASLADQGTVDRQRVGEAIRRYRIDTDASHPINR
jgi:pyruvate dehydrogenase E1 component